MIKLADQRTERQRTRSVVNRVAAKNDQAVDLFTLDLFGKIGDRVQCGNAIGIRQFASRTVSPMLPSSSFKR